MSSRALRIGEHRAKGYELTDFTDAFERFLPNAHPAKPESRLPREVASPGVALSA